MITREKFDFIKEKYGYYSSWAIWSDENEKPKSNIGDLSILNPDLNSDLLSQLNTEVILLGLNISRGDIKTPLANFHDERPEATDYKIRYAFRDSPYWGGYMTDIIKDFDQKISGKEYGKRKGWGDKEGSKMSYNPRGGSAQNTNKYKSRQGWSDHGVEHAYEDGGIVGAAKKEALMQLRSQMQELGGSSLSDSLSGNNYEDGGIVSSERSSEEEYPINQKHN